MLIGAHVPQEDPLGEARGIGAEAIQMFLGNPQSFEKPKPRADIRSPECAAHIITSSGFNSSRLTAVR